MLVQADPVTRPTRVIVVGNEKGGSGKSTIAIHVAIALLKAGQRVATIDLDCRQKSLSRFVENRAAWSAARGLNLEMPTHHCVTRSEGLRVDENEAAEFDNFIDKVSVSEHAHDFIVIDTPGSDSYLMRLAHAMADTLITPLNDSFVDFDVLGNIDPVTCAVIEESHYSETVRVARRQHRTVERQEIDWIVVRNRLANPVSRTWRLLAEGLDRLGLQLGFRCTEGFSDRAIYRELFPHGLTVLDDFKPVLGARPNRSHHAARREIEALLAALKLPIDSKGLRRAAVRSEWFAGSDKPLVLDEILS